MSDVYALLAVLVGVMILMALLMVCGAISNLWTSLVLGSIVSSWYRQRCMTDDTGVETGAYALRQKADGTFERIPVEQAEETADEWKQQSSESESRGAWWRQYMMGK